MILVVAIIGSYGLLGTEALQSCLSYQLDLRMGQMWAEGRSTLQVHQQRQALRVSAHLITSVMLPPDNEVVAPVSVRYSSGIRPGPCSLMEPCMTLKGNYGVLVVCTLVDALMVNPISEVVVLPLSPVWGTWSRCRQYLVVRSESVSTKEEGAAGPPGGHCNRIPPLLVEGRLAVA